MANETFGEFLTRIAEKSDPVSKNNIDLIKKEIEEQEREKIKNLIFLIKSKIDEQVQDLRQLDRMRTATREKIKKLESLAEQVVLGKIKSNDDLQEQLRRAL